MDFSTEFVRIMKEAKNIALASSVNDNPNVRIVNFYYNPQHIGIIYFSTLRGHAKTEEFSQNNKVAFTSIPIAPTENSAHIRVKQGTIEKSSLTVYDLKEEFVKKLPSFEMMIAQVGDKLDVYEVHFTEAYVIINPKQSGVVTF